MIVAVCLFALIGTALALAFYWRKSVIEIRAEKRAAEQRQAFENRRVALQIVTDNDRLWAGRR